MKIENEGGTLCVSDIPELNSVNSGLFREKVEAALPPALAVIEIDLSQTQFVDSSGLGALIALHRRATQGEPAAVVRLLNPPPPVQQLFELTRMHQLFEIVKR